MGAVVAIPITLMGVLASAFRLFLVSKRNWLKDRKSYPEATHVRDTLGLDIAHGGLGDNGKQFCDLVSSVIALVYGSTVDHAPQGQMRAFCDALADGIKTATVNGSEVLIPHRGVLVYFSHPTAFCNRLGRPDMNPDVWKHMAEVSKTLARFVQTRLASAGTHDPQPLPPEYPTGKVVLV